jgi:peroxiredoxin
VARWIGAFFVAAMIVAVLAFYTFKGRFSQNEKRPATVVDTKVNKLGIETPKTKTAAPEFVLKDPAGKQVSLRELRGKIVFLNFWATWCLPCVEEMPAIEKLHQELAKYGLIVLAVNFQEGPERVRDFFTEHNLTFTALLDRDGKVAELYQVWGLPVSVVINKRGEIVGRAVGSKNWYSNEALQYFQRLLAEET